MTDKQKVTMPGVLKVVRKRMGGPAELYIDGELFRWATIDGFEVRPNRGSQPGVTLTIAAMRVEVEDGFPADKARPVIFDRTEAIPTCPSCHSPAAAVGGCQNLWHVEVR